MAAILEPEPEPRTQSRTTEHLLAVLAVGAALAFCWLARELLVPAVLGIFAAYAVQPIVTRLRRMGAPLTLAATVGTLVAVLAVVAIGVLLYTQLDAFMQDLPKYQERVRDVARAFAKLRHQSERLMPGSTPPGAMKVDQVVPWGTMLLGTALSAASAILGALVAIFTLYFTLADGPRYREKLLAAAGTPAARAHIREAIAEIHRDVGQYVVNRVVLNGATGLVAGIAFAIYGLPHAAVWGLTTALCHLVPYVGTAFGFLLPVGAAFLGSGSLRDPIIVGAIYLVIMTIEGNVIDPIFLGKQLKMNSLAVFLGSLFWYWIWGPVGLLLAAPLLSATKIICSHVPRWRLAAELIAD